jgi:hypothetical protein
MKATLVYRCKYCKKESRDAAVIEACEASHYGLTVAEMRQWKKLEKQVKDACGICSVTHNEKTEKDADDAIGVLLRFEREHHLEE